MAAALGRARARRSSARAGRSGRAVAEGPPPRRHTDRCADAARGGRSAPGLGGRLFVRGACCGGLAAKGGEPPELASSRVDGLVPTAEASHVGAPRRVFGRRGFPMFARRPTALADVLGHQRSQQPGARPAVSGKACTGAYPQLMQAAPWHASCSRSKGVPAPSAVDRLGAGPAIDSVFPVAPRRHAPIGLDPLLHLDERNAPTNGVHVHHGRAGWRTSGGRARVVALRW